MQREVDNDGNRCSFDEDDIEFYRTSPLRYKIAKELHEEWSKIFVQKAYFINFKEWLEEKERTE